jgi:transposase
VLHREIFRESLDHIQKYLARFNRWSKVGIWKDLFLKIRGEIDEEWNFIDSTIVKAYQHSVNCVLPTSLNDLKT